MAVDDAICLRLIKRENHKVGGSCLGMIVAESCLVWDSHPLAKLLGLCRLKLQQKRLHRLTRGFRTAARCARWEQTRASSSH
jgi:hypothetical protein